MKRNGLRVLFVNRMLTMERGGGETFDLEISRHLEKKGCQISYLSGVPLSGRAGLPLDHPRSHTVRTPYLGWLPWDKMKGGWRLRLADFYMFERSAVRWAYRNRQAYDVVQVCELPHFVRYWKQYATGIPVVIRLTAPNYFDRHGGIAMADAVMASGTTVEKLRAGPLPSCVDIPNAVDTEMFRPHASSFRARHGLSADELIVLYVARFQAFKNHELLIRAFAQVRRELPQARLVLAGGGPLERRMRELCRATGVHDRVLFLGEVPYAELPDVYAAATIKVISSDYESFCFAALEAMATGLPIVTTDCGWAPRLIGGTRSSEIREGGVVVPVGNAQALADAIVWLARQSDLCENMGVWNRNKAVREHGWAGSAEKLLALYGRLLSPCAPETER